MWLSTSSMSNVVLTTTISKHFVQQQYNDTPKLLTHSLSFETLLHQLICWNLITCQQSLSITYCKTKILHGNVAHLIIPSLLSYDECLTPAAMRIRFIIFYLMLWLSATTLGLTWVNMPKSLRKMSTSIPTLLVLQLWRLSLPTKSSSIIKGNLLSEIWTLHLWPKLLWSR